MNLTSERNHVVHLVLDSLKWTLSNSATKSPVDAYIDSKNKELGKEAKGWLPKMLFDANVESKDPASMPSFFLLLLHSVSAGNPNGNFVASLAKAWGIAPNTLKARNIKTAVYLLAPDPELADAFKDSLKFKVSVKCTDNKNNVFHYIDRKNQEENSHGWLRETFLRSIKNPSELKDEKCKLLILLYAICSCCPNDNLIEMITHAWGVNNPTTLFNYASSHFPLLLVQVSMTQLQPTCLDTCLPFALPAIVSPEWAPYLATETRANNFDPSPRPTQNITQNITPTQNNSKSSTIPFVSPNSNVPEASVFDSPPPLPDATKSSTVPFEHRQVLGALETSTFRLPSPGPNAVDSLAPWNIQMLLETSKENQCWLILGGKVLSIPSQESENHCLMCGALARRKEQEPRKTDVETPVDSEDRALQTMEDMEAIDGVVLLHRKDRMGRKHAAAKYLRLPVRSTQDANKLSKDRLQKKSKIMETLLRELGEDSHDTILREICRRKGYSIQSTAEQAESTLKIPEAYALMKLTHSTIRQMGGIDTFLRHLRGIHIFPKMFVKQLSAFEKMCGLPAVSSIMKLITKKGEDKKPDSYEMCSFVALEHPHRAIAMLIEGCLKAGKLMPASVFSNHSNKKLILPFGCDRGGDSTSMLVRLANRDHGNGKSYCSMISSYEKGAECHPNLRGTVYRKGSAHHDLIQSLVLDKFHSIVVTKKVGGEVVSVEVAVVQMVEGPGASQGKVLQSIDVELIGGEDFEYDAGLLKTMPKVYEARPKCLELTEKSDLAIFIHFVKSWDGTKYAGFVLRKDALTVFDFTFESEIDSANGDFNFECYQLLGFPSHDTKHGWLVGGISPTASVSCNCLVCVADKWFYQQFPPKWVQQRYPEMESFQTPLPDEPMRTGQHSTKKMWDYHEMSTSEGKRSLKGAATTKLNKNCAGITHEPLLFIPPSKDPLAPMHTPHGLCNHFRENVRKDLLSVDEKEGSWQREVARVLQEAKDVTNMNWKEAERMQTTFLQNTSRKENEIRTKRKNGASQAVIERAEMQLEKLRQDLDSHLIDSGLGRHNQLCRGAERVSKAIKEYTDPKSKKPRGKAEFVYMQAIPIFAKVNYRKEYGGKQLSHRDNMQVLQAWDKVRKVVCAAFDDNPGQQELVASIMEKSEKLATPLLTLCKLLKSQEKIEAEKIETIKDTIAKIYYGWSIHYPLQACFPKLHHLVWHVISFIVEHGMYGVLSEEGFEAIHPLINRIINDLKPMMDTKKRLQTTLNRLTSSLDSGVESITQEYNVKKATKSQRPTEYKKQGRSRNAESGSIIYTGIQADPDDENYLMLPESKDLIKTSWREVAEFVCYSQAPASWSRVFADSEDLGNVKKEEATIC